MLLFCKTARHPVNSQGGRKEDGGMLFTYTLVMELPWNLKEIFELNSLQLLYQIHETPEKVSHLKKLKLILVAK